ncbi:unnamed protein product [marine sediment metagenome]|uniref:Uncharacterized protein n=1 Tax=marine sediment metagenome TaxID=412755 RepID=X1TI01_9ZZZZ
MRYVIFNSNAHQQLTRLNNGAPIELLAVDTALWHSLVYAGMDREEAKKHANGWVDRNIKS